MKGGRTQTKYLLYSSVSGAPYDIKGWFCLPFMVIWFENLIYWKPLLSLCLQLLILSALKAESLHYWKGSYLVLGSIKIVYVIPQWMQNEKVKSAAGSNNGVPEIECLSRSRTGRCSTEVWRYSKVPHAIIWTLQICLTCTSCFHHLLMSTRGIKELIILISHIRPSSPLSLGRAGRCWHMQWY